MGMIGLEAGRETVVALGVALLLVGTSHATSAPSRGDRDDELALVGGTIYADPAQGPIEDGVVLIGDGKIAEVGRRESVQVPAGVAIVDCAGLTITAGFWNCHVH